MAADDIIKTGDWPDAPAVFDILQDLCDDSLLRQDKSVDGSIRYGMLESIRQYSNGKLSTEESIEQRVRCNERSLNIYNEQQKWKTYLLCSNSQPLWRINATMNVMFHHQLQIFTRGGIDGLILLSLYYKVT